MRYNLLEFTRESNGIEGIFRNPTKEEVEAAEEFLGLAVITVADLQKFVSVYQPDAVLRTVPYLNVQVGNHIAPMGGPKILYKLDSILDAAMREHPYQVHLKYETLHPFTDGNGRSGRILWRWGMHRQNLPLARLGFLQTFYYQTLDNIRE